MLLDDRPPSFISLCGEGGPSFFPIRYFEIFLLSPFYIDIALDHDDLMTSLFLRRETLVMGTPFRFARPSIARRLELYVVKFLDSLSLPFPFVLALVPF